MWFSAIKMAISAGSHIYKKRAETKMRMADAQYLHAEKMAKGEEAYQGKLLEARQNDYKDEVVLCILTLPILVLAYGVWSDDPEAIRMKKHLQQSIPLMGFPTGTDMNLLFDGMKKTISQLKVKIDNR